MSEATRKVPSGYMVEVSSTNIDEGKLTQLMDAALRKAHAELMAAHKATGQAGLKAKINLGAIVLSLDSDLKDTIRIEYATPTVVPPSVKRASLASTKAGVMLAQPGGPGKDDPSQMRMFTADGKTAVTVDTTTGELIDEPEETGVAGEIKAAGNGA